MIFYKWVNYTMIVDEKINLITMFTNYQSVFNKKKNEKYKHINYRLKTIILISEMSKNCEKPFFLSLLFGSKR